MILQQQSNPVPVPLPLVDTVVQFCNHVALYGMKIFQFVLITVILFGRTTRSNKKTITSPSSSPAIASSKATKNGALLFAMLPQSLMEYLSSSSSSSSFSTLFLQWHGWSHRLAGGAHLCWIIIGTIYVIRPRPDAVDDGGDDNHIESYISDSWRCRTFIYDVVLGCLGIIATLTASKDFPHKYVTNAKGQSGTLHSTAIVTQSEMIEHCFYQFLNLWQSFYLHTMSYYNDKYSYHLSNSQGSPSDPNSNKMFGTMDDVIDISCRLGMLWIVTSPWLVRLMLPVHSFSHNWKLYQRQVQQVEQQQQRQEQSRIQQKNPQEEESTPTKLSTTNFHPNRNKNRDDDIEILLYRIKKAQYIFYKHVILHGVNIYSISSSNSNIRSSNNSYNNNNTIPHSVSWRIFWLLLNLSYVMEFFLQSLVKRNILTQYTMLYFQRWLIVTASISAICVLIEIPYSHYYNNYDNGNDYSHSYYYYYSSFWLVCFTSFVLNFVHRYHDVLNTMAIGTLLLVTSHVQTFL